MPSKVTIQNGQFQDAAGTAIVGTLVLQLSQDAVVSGTGTVAPTSISIVVTAGNAVATPVWGNDNLTPSGTTYTATLFDTSGARVWGPENWSIAGAGPIEINTLVPSTGSVSYSGAVLLAPSGDQTISSSHLLNASLGTVTAGNINSIRVVDGVKFTTIASAVADLPTRSIGGRNYAVGTVFIPSGTYTLTSALTIASPFVRLVGEGSRHTIINCSGIAGDCIAFTNPATATNALGTGGLEGLSLVGDGTANQVGLHAIDQTCGFVLNDVIFDSFNGTSNIAANFEDALLWTERTRFAKVDFYHCTLGIQLKGGGASGGSFGHNTWVDVRFNLNQNQTAISLLSNANLYGSLITGVVNHDNTTGNSTVFSLAGTAQVANTTLLNLNSDLNGGGTAVGVSSVSGTTFAATGNFSGYSSNSASGTFVATLPFSGPPTDIQYLTTPTHFGLAALNGSQGVFILPQLNAAGGFYQGVGLNVKFDGTNFITVPDNSNNGGSVILTKQSDGALKFYQIPSTGNTAQTISPATLDSTYLRATLDSTGLKLTTGLTATSTLVAPQSTGSAVFAMDTAATGITIANNATATPFGNSNNFSGLLIVQELTAGNMAVFITGGGNIALVSQTSSNFSTTSGTAAKANVFLSTSVLTVENKLGSSSEFRITAFRTRTSQ